MGGQMRKISFLSVIGVLFIFSLIFSGSWGCGAATSTSDAGGGTAGTGGTGGTGGSSTTSELAVAFPTDLAVSSPTASTSSTSDLRVALRAGRSKNVAENSESIRPMPFSEKKEALNNLLNPTTPGSPPPIPEGAINFEKSAPPVECYGPALFWSGTHPDGGGQNQQNQYPPLDLGFWIETEPDTGEACPAALTNNIMGEIENYVNMIMVPAGALGVAADGGSALPAQGEELDLATFAGEVVEGSNLPMEVTTATLSREAEDNSEGFPVFVTSTTGTINVTEIQGQTASEAPTFEMTIQHIPEVEMDAASLRIKSDAVPEAETYCGLVQQKVNLPADSQNMNFQGCTAMTQCISVTYCKNSATSMTYLLKKAEFCGADADCFDSNGEVTTTARQNQQQQQQQPQGGNPPPLVLKNTGESTGWSANFFYILAEVNPEDGTGSVVQAWVAGSSDALSRIANISTTANSDGTITGIGYFGFGVPPDSETGTVGEIDRMICNWAGPGGAISTMDYTGVQKAQGQAFTKNSAGLFVSDDDDAVNITYAPTNSCDKAAGTFSYGTTQAANDVAGSDVITNDLIDLDDVDFTMPTVPTITITQ